jgi:exonuclease SbcC
MREAEQLASDKSSEAKELRGGVQSLGRTIIEQAKQWGEVPDVGQIPQLLVQWRQSLSQSSRQTSLQVTEAKRLKTRLKELQTLLPTLQAQQEKLQETLSDSAKNLSALEVRKQEKEMQYNALRQKLPYADEETAREKNKTLDALLKQQKEQLDTLRNNCTAEQLAVESCRSSCQTIEEHLSKEPELHLEAAQTALEEAQQRQSALREQLTTLYGRLKTNQAAAEQLTQLQEAFQAAEERRNMVDALARTACGTVSGKDAVDLETYVQQAYFDRILARANLRLLRMSGGQYELVRRGGGDKRKKSGLALNVLDHASGTERDAGSLSGGETFLASLSLALGLSDEIQSSSGGIRLESMFIDEGFGSLDQQTLSLAIRTLEELSEQSGMVGIISHVQELQTRIPKQIVVKKLHAGGSRVEVITG